MAQKMQIVFNVTGDWDMTRHLTAFALNECWSPHVRLSELTAAHEPEPETTSVLPVSECELEATDPGGPLAEPVVVTSPLFDPPTLPPPLREGRSTRILNAQVALVEWETDLPSSIL